MKIKVIKACTFSFAPAEKIVYFIVDEVCDLPEDRAKRLINNDYAVKYSEHEQSEQKMDKTEPENKMFNVKHSENKAEDSEEDSENEVNVKHEDNIAEDSEEDSENKVNVKHEDNVEEKEEKSKKRGRPKKNK